MRVLVLEADRVERRRVSKILASLGHEVSAPECSADLKKGLSRAPDVAIVGHADRRIAEWRAKLDAESQRRHIYTIASLRIFKPTQIAEAWATGVDDIMSRGACAEEIIGRIEAVNRFRAWMGSKSSLDGFDVDSLSTIRQFNGLISQELGDLLGCQLATKQLRDLPHIAHAAEISLTLPEEDLEVKIGVALDEANAKGLAELLFGKVVGIDVLTDAVREFANTAGGAFKRCAHLDGQNFAVGLPTNAETASWPDQAKIWTAFSDDLKLIIWVTHSSVGRRRIRARDLLEGMVLARDVRGAWGGLLVSAGAVLTERTVRRLVDLVGPGGLVEVSSGADTPAEVAA